MIFIFSEKSPCALTVCSSYQLHSSPHIYPTEAQSKKLLPSEGFLLALACLSPLRRGSWSSSEDVMSRKLNHFAHCIQRVVIYTQLLVKSPFGKESPSWLWHLNTNWKPDLCIRMASHHMTASVAPTTQPQPQVYFQENNNYYGLNSSMHYAQGPEMNAESPTRRRASPVTSGQPAHGKKIEDFVSVCFGRFKRFFALF